MEDKINQLQSQINALQQQVDLMRSSATYPYDMEQALTDRLNPISLSPSIKTAASETITITGSDAATPMDGFEQRTVDGVIRYYPYYL